MELEELKEGWKEMNERMDKLEIKGDELVNRIAQNRIISAQQRLKREYQMMTVICLLPPSWIVIMQRNIEGLGDWVVYMFFIFFWVMAFHKGFVWWKLAHLNYREMTIKEALVSTYKLEKYQKTGMLVGISLAIPLLICFISLLYQMHEMYAFYGAWCGLVVGLLIGLKVRRRIKKEMKEMRGALQDELN